MSEWRNLPAGKIARQRKEIVRLEPGNQYRTMGVRWYGKGAYDRGLVTTETVKAKSLYRARQGDFVFNRIDTHKGAFDVVPTELDGALATNEFPLYEVDEEEVDTRFLLLNFQRPEVLGQIGAMRAGSEGRARWKEADFEAWMVPLPPLPIQKRIVEIIGAIDGQVNTLTAESEALVKLRTGLVGRSADTRQVALGSLGVVSQGKGLPKKYQGIRTGEVSWYKIADMTGPGNEFGYTVADTRLTSREVAEIGGVVVRAGAVTFPRVGAAVLTEKKRIMDTPGALDENHLVITPGEETNSEYLLAVMESFALSTLVRPGAVPSLNMGLIRSTTVPWSWSENQSLGTALGALRAESRALAAEASRLREVQAVVLSRLLDRTIDIEPTELGV